MLSFIAKEVTNECENELIFAAAALKSNPVIKEGLENFMK
jgi:hypothetical protein